MVLNNTGSGRGCGGELCAGELCCVHIVNDIANDHNAEFVQVAYPTGRQTLLCLGFIL